MQNLKIRLRRLVYSTPNGENLWRLVAELVGRAKPDFSGWGMTTYTATPWNDGGGDDTVRAFVRANEEISDNVRRGDFKLTQFSSVEDKDKVLRELMWRHYIVFWSVSYASQGTVCPVKNLVECGVCDGLTIFFAMRAARSKTRFKAFLYDAWAGMRSEDLLDSEKKNAGAYSYLDVENTKRNLSAFHGDTVFNRGRIPESFETSDNPTEIAWIHIDLNSSVATTAALKFFYDRLAHGGVILFDDYGFHDFEDSKPVVDQFFSGRNGILFPLPTGQAIYFKP